VPEQLLEAQKRSKPFPRAIANPKPFPKEPIPYYKYYKHYKYYKYYKYHKFIGKKTVLIRFQL